MDVRSASIRPPEIRTEWGFVLVDYYKFSDEHAVTCRLY